jgi:acetolactate synthase I/III small subunit
MMHMYTVTARTENALRVLQRIASIFSRLRINVEQLNVYETSVKGTSRFNIVIQSEPHTVDKLLKQLGKIVELIDVTASR